MVPDCTLVTCCFDLIKYNEKGRTHEQALDNFKPLLEVPCYLVIYTDINMFERIKLIRSSYELNHLTKYIVMNVEDLDTFKYLDIVKKNREKYHPTRDERNCTESHLVCSSKFELVLKSMNENPFNTTKFGWIDSNVRKNFSKICIDYKNNMLLNILKNSVSDKFQIQILNVCDKKFTNNEHIQEYYSQYRWVVCGCLFITGKEIGEKILTELNNNFIEHTLKGYGHGEEMFYLDILDKYYDDIKRSYGDYQHILNNFIHIQTGFQYILYISNRYLQHNYHRECVECCEKVLESFDNFIIEMNYEMYWYFLFNLYVASFYVDKSKATNTLTKMKKLIIEQPRIREYYLIRKDFYDNQFSFCNSV
jgi:hypothetical protein